MVESSDDPETSNSYEQWLGEEGFVAFNVDGDGNCMFRAIAKCLEGKENTNHELVRFWIADEVESNFGRYDGSPPKI